MVLELVQTLSCLEQRFPNNFERGPNLGLVNISRPKPQAAYVNMKK